MEELNKKKLTKEILNTVRDIEGFPIGKDEDIITLSDPPYYTACPNPFINDFIEKYGTSYSEETDDYEVEPYAADVSEGKNDPIYRAHTYHTKVPHKAIMRYILHYTKPGNIVFDGFCGTGMTGVAAQMCADPDPDFKLQIEKEMPGVQWGARKAILSDLSPAATFIAYNYSTPVDVRAFEREAERILAEVEEECGWMYETLHMIDGKVQYGFDGTPRKGRINYTVWSDVFVCSNCANELVFWDVAVDERTGKVKDEFQCGSCGAIHKKRDLERAITTMYDDSLGANIQVAKQIPVLINYSVGRTRYNKKPDDYDFEVIERINATEIPYWFPIDRMPEGDESRRNDKFGITYVHHFYTKRNLWVIGALFNYIHLTGDFYVENKMIWSLTSIQNYINKKQSFGGGGGGVSGTLYIPSLVQEKNIFDVYLRKLKRNAKLQLNTDVRNINITTQSTICLKNIPGNTIDYIFTDPPFGNNLMYSELNFIWEAWLKVFTNSETEAIMNKVQRKGLPEYQEIMERCFAEYYRVLKPGRWMTVEFHNSKNSVWNVIQEAILRAGFVVANVRTLDKKQGSFKQVTTASAVKQDLIISAYKPRDSFMEKFLAEAGTEEGVWNFVREHLKKLSVIVEKDGMLDIIPERQNYLLYDAMIAFHIQKGASIPLGAADFYKGLTQRFPERDGMYFLPNQVNKYDVKRLRMKVGDQLPLFVMDEKTAIQWLYMELEKPQTYQEIQPKFMQEMHRAKHEKEIELIDILRENFLQNEEEQWYVPDLNKRSDLEKLREKNLLKEFEEYKDSKGRLRVFRTEAIRAGFKKCWQDRDYKTIVKIGERLPENVLQEDNSILMYYDNACTRMGD